MPKNGARVLEFPKACSCPYPMQAGSSYRSSIRALLDAQQNRGSFAVEGTLPPHGVGSPLLSGLPALGVTTMSQPLVFPLVPAQAAQLISAATKAGFGKGSQTIMDEDIRFVTSRV